MTESEIKNAENFARENLRRCQTLEARIVNGRGNTNNTYGGIVPNLCEMVLRLTAELKQQRAR